MVVIAIAASAVGLGSPSRASLLAGFALVQVGRAVRMADWGRRVLALALVFGVFAVTLGIDPSGFCLSATGPGCGPGLSPRPLLVLAGLAMTGLAVRFDVDRAAVR